jgi:ubiquinone/menaquinone biosynthesis C-methylase UbiE
MQAALPTPSDPAHVPHRTHVCPWWLGWTLIFPLRRWLQRPESWLDAVVRSGDRVLEVGPGMGFFTVPLAERVGPTGRIWCVDLQPRMLTALGRRLRRRALAERVTLRACSAEDLNVADLSGSMDLALLIYVLHEVPDPRRTLEQVAASLRVGGRVLLVEPRGHCSAEMFAEQLRISRELGLVPREGELGPKLHGRQAALLEKIRADRVL